LTQAERFFTVTLSFRAFQVASVRSLQPQFLVGPGSGGGAGLVGGLGVGVGPAVGSGVGAGVGELGLGGLGLVGAPGLGLPPSLQAIANADRQTIARNLLNIWTS
jgi:hypothetical protein